MDSKMKMKTDQLLTVNVGGHALQIYHLTGMGNLTELWAIGNAYRVERGLEPLDLRHWMRRPQTEEFVRLVEQELKIENKDDSKCAESAQMEFIENPNKKDGCVPTVKSKLIKTKKGRYGGTWAHLYILLDAAMYLDAKLRLEMIKLFINNKLLEWRDSSGDEFKSLNVEIDADLPGLEGKDKTEVYIRCAIAIKRKISPVGNDWNQATTEQLEQRTNYEKTLIQFLKMGMVKDEDHLLEIIGKL